VEIAMRIALKTMLATAILVAVVHATEFTSQYTAKGIEARSFAGKKIAALVISDDLALRMSAEEALVRQLNERGVKGIASYKMIPAPELKDKDKAKAWFEKAGVQGVVVLRPVVLEMKVTKYEPQWVSGYYQSFWGYYGYGWSSVYVPGGTMRQAIVIVETMAYDVTKDMLLWGAVSDVRDPENMDAYMKELVKDSAKEMKKAGLIKK
jgi:hypothetical protein